MIMRIQIRIIRLLSTLWATVVTEFGGLHTMLDGEVILIYYLELEADTYLNNAVFPKNSYHTSPFIKGVDVLEINNPTQSSIQIIDNQGNVSGFYNDMIFSEIPGTIPSIDKKRQRNSTLWIFTTNRYLLCSS